MATDAVKNYHKWARKKSSGEKPEAVKRYHAWAANTPLKSIYGNAKEPKYTFNEAMSLSQYGYTGLFGRGKKQTVSLLGENWQKAAALDALKNNYYVPVFDPEHVEDTERIKELAAADIMVPGTKAYNSTVELYNRFTSKYGADGAGFVKRYGGMPSPEGKYGLLFDVNNRKVKREDVQATYQNNLARELGKIGKELTSEDMP